MARNKDPLFKRRLYSMRRSRMRAPPWVIRRARRILFPVKDPRESLVKIHWRRTNFGRRIRHG